MEEKNNQIWKTTTILSVLALFVAIIAAIPSFLSLEKPVSKLFYSEISNLLNIPKEIDTDELKKLMETNKIPRATYELSLKNLGNSSAELVKISISSDQKIMNLSFIPDKNEHPIWVDFKDIIYLNDSTRIKIELEDLAINHELKVIVGYAEKLPTEILSEIINNGLTAELSENLEKEPQWNKFQLFRLPLFILAGGLIITILVSIVIFIIKSKKFREQLLEISKDVYLEIFPFVLPGINIYEAMKILSKKDKNKGENQ